MWVRDGAGVPILDTVWSLSLDSGDQTGPCDSENELVDSTPGRNIPVRRR